MTGTRSSVLHTHPSVVLSFPQRRADMARRRMSRSRTHIFQTGHVNFVQSIERGIEVRPSCRYEYGPRSNGILAFRQYHKIRCPIETAPGRPTGPAGRPGLVDIREARPPGEEPRGRLDDANRTLGSTPPCIESWSYREHVATLAIPLRAHRHTTSDTRESVGASFRCVVLHRDPYGLARAHMPGCVVGDALHGVDPVWGVLRVPLSQIPVKEAPAMKDLRSARAFDLKLHSVYVIVTRRRRK